MLIMMLNMMMIVEKRKKKKNMMMILTNRTPVSLKRYYIDVDMKHRIHRSKSVALVQCRWLVLVYYFIVIKFAFCFQYIRIGFNPLLLMYLDIPQSIPHFAVVWQ